MGNYRPEGAGVLFRSAFSVSPANTHVTRAKKAILQKNGSSDRVHLNGRSTVNHLKFLKSPEEYLLRPFPPSWRRYKRCWSTRSVREIGSTKLSSTVTAL